LYIKMDLTCPISLDIMEDPITTPCGHTFDRKSMMNLFSGHKKVCPLCRTNLMDYDPTNVGTCYLLAEIIDEKARKEVRNEMSFLERLAYPLFTSAGYFF